VGRENLGGGGEVISIKTKGEREITIDGTPQTQLFCVSLRNTETESFPITSE